MLRHFARAMIARSTARHAALLAMGTAIACDGRIVDPNSTATIASFDIAPKQAPADGASLLRVTASVAPGVAPSTRSVSFTTTLGSFGNQANTTSDADGDRQAVALLTASPTPGTALVTAKLGSTVIRREVTFERALAESIEIGSAAPSVTSGFASSLLLTITLRRSTGKPTAGDTVSLSASAGLLSRPTRSSADGLITASFTPGELPAGPVTIKATAVGNGGKTLSDSVTVRVLPAR